MRVQRGWLAVLAALGMLGQGACGYQMVHYARALPDAERIAIRSFENHSFEPGVDRLLSEALQREFLRTGGLEVVDDPAAADLVLEGAVASVSVRSRSFSSIAFALEFEVRMVLELTVTRSDGSLVEIDPNALAESELYLASADVEVARTNREEAMRRLTSALAGRIHDALYERVIQ